MATHSFSFTLRALRFPPLVRWALGVFSFVSVNPAFARGVSLGSGGTGFFSGLTTLLQDFVDFLSGPWVVFALVVASVAAVIGWMMSPKDGVMSTLVRVLIGGVVILDLGGVVNYLQSMGT